jgi:hypothetical protein
MSIATWSMLLVAMSFRPQSGDVIKIININDAESGYFGATRPLT